MKISDFKSISNISDLENLIRFVSIDMNLFLSAINGGIDLLDNCSTNLVDVQFAVANRAYPFAHSLNRVPSGFINVGTNVAAILFNGNQNNTISQIYIQSSVAGATGKVLVF
jgi:hypothetical protein